MRLATSERLADRLAASLKNCIAAAHERHEFNAQSFLTASGIIWQPRCPKLISLRIVFRIRDRNSYWLSGVLRWFLADLRVPTTSAFLPAKQTSDDDAGDAIAVHGTMAQHADEPKRCHGIDRGYEIGWPIRIR